MNKNFIILGLSAILIFMLSFNTCDKQHIDIKQNDTSIVVVDTLWFNDTNIVNKDSLVIRYKTKVKDSTIYNIIDSLKLDSAAIAEEYFCKNFYDDTLEIDSLLTVRIQENTFMNKVENRSVLVTRRTPVIKEVLEVKYPFKSKLFIGGEISGSGEFLDVGPAAWYTPNKCWLIGGSYGLRNKTINIHAGYRIK